MAYTLYRIQWVNDSVLLEPRYIILSLSFSSHIVKTNKSLLIS